MLPVPFVQALQVLTVLVVAPGINGVISRVETRLQAGVGHACYSPTTTSASCSARRRWHRSARVGCSSRRRWSR